MSADPIGEFLRLHQGNDGEDRADDEGQPEDREDADPQGGLRQGVGDGLGGGVAAVGKTSRMLTYSVPGKCGAARPTAAGFAGAYP